MVIIKLDKTKKQLIFILFSKGTNNFEQTKSLNDNYFVTEGAI